MMVDERFRQYAEIFMKNSAPSDIKLAGEEILKLLYGGNSIESLNHLRYRKFVHKANVSRSVVQVQTLPPTEAASAFHSFRSYL